MKKFILGAFCFIFMFLCGCGEGEKIREDKIYFFFYDGCPYCHYAMEYINQKYPDLEMTKVDIYQKPGYKLFEACGQKFNLKTIGTPLFCMGDKYIMGWSKSTEKKFDLYVRPFLKK